MAALRWAVRAVVVIGLGLLLVSCEFSPPLEFAVTTSVDGSDAVAGDGVCEMTVGAGDCSLRAAVDEANAATDQQVVVAIPPGDYALTAPGVDDTNQGGDLDVTRSGGLILVAADHGRFALDANGAEMAVDVHAGSVFVGGAGISGSSGAGVRVGDGALLSLVHGATFANTGPGASVASGGRLVVWNETISSNGGAGIDTQGTVELVQVTVAANGAGGIAGSGTVSAAASVIVDQVAGADCAGVGPVSSGANLDSDGSCGLSGPDDVSAVDPRLAGLSGGPVPTHQPLFGSPVIDASAPGTGVCPGPDGTSVDQLGTPRPQGGRCDRGAVESLAANDLVVDVTNDGRDATPGDGICEATPGAGDCTVRAAVDEVNAAPPGPGRTITLTVSPVITLGGGGGGGEDANAKGDLDLTGDVVLRGGGHTITASNNGDRVLDQRAGTAELQDLTITGGQPRAGSKPFGGGGILTAGTLRLDRVIVTGNSAIGPSAPGQYVSFSAPGSGIAATPTSHVTIVDSTISSNRLSGSLVASRPETTDGIVTAGFLEVQGSTIADNGGGLVPDQKSGIEVFAGGTATIDSSTIVDHARALKVGQGGHLMVTRSTIDETGTGAEVGGELDVVASTVVTTALAFDNSVLSTVQLSGTAVAGGCAAAVLSSGWNVAPSSCGLAGPGDRSDLDLDLAELDDTGGATRTRLPFAGSPLVDAIPLGTAGLCDGSAIASFDQRGVTRPDGPACDVGAVEGGRVLAPTLFLTVDTSSDEPDLAVGDGACTTASGGCSLRAALQETNVNLKADTVTIEPGLAPIVLSTQMPGDGVQLVIEDPLLIEGNGATVDADRLGRVLSHRGGSPVEIRDLTVTGGRAALGGGGIGSEGGLTLVRVHVTDNWVVTQAIHDSYAYGWGAGISTSDLTLIESSVTANGWENLSGSRAERAAGVSAAGALVLDRSTISGNGASASPIDSQAESGPGTIVSDSTVDGTTPSGPTNTALTVNGATRIERSTIGGGLFSLRLEDLTTVDLVASTVTSTNQAITRGPNSYDVTLVRASGSILFGGFKTCNAPVESLGWNIDSGSSCGLNTTGDSPFTAVELGPLADNGGSTLTRLPAAGSVAIDRIPVGTPGLCDGSQPADQRGAPRPSGPGCDVGAVEQ